MAGLAIERGLVRHLEPAAGRQERRAVAGPGLGAAEPVRAAVGEVVERKLLDPGPLLRFQRPQFRRFRREPSQRQAFGQLLLPVSHKPQPLLDQAAARGAETDLLHQSRLGQHPHGLGGDGVAVEAAGEPQGGARRLQKGQELIRAVLVEEVVAEPGAAQLPEVAQELVQLLPVQGEAELPDVPVLQVAVVFHRRVVGGDRVAAAVAPEETLDGVGDAALLAGVGGVVDGVGQKGGHGARLGRVDAQKGVPEHRGGVVQVGGGKHQGEAAGVHLGEPAFEVAAAWLRQPLRVDGQRPAQPVETGRVAARAACFGMYRVFWEEGRQRGLKLGLRVVFAPGGQEKGRVVHLALHAFGEPSGSVVQEGVPLGALGQPCLSGPLDEPRQGAVVRCGAGRQGQPGQRQEQGEAVPG